MNFTLPTAILGDYIQMAANSFYLVVGLPLNLITFWQVKKQYAVRRGRIPLLYLHLNVSDLMVLVWCSGTKLGWLIAYEWHAGDIACKLAKMLEVLSFAISSYVVVCIGFDRMYSLYWPFRAEDSLRVKRMLIAAWSIAAIVAAPQLTLFQAREVLPDFYQCVSILVSNPSSSSSNSTNLAVNSTMAVESPENLVYLWKRLYSIYHVVTLFWIPLLLIVGCYAMTNSVVRNQHGLNDVPQSSLAELQGQQRRSYGALIKLTGQTVLAIGQVPFIDVHTLRRMTGHARMRRARSKTLRTTLLIVCIYIGCWLPYNILMCWYIVDEESYHVFENYTYFLHGLVVLNSVINPLIYGTGQLEFLRRQLYKLDYCSNRDDVSRARSDTTVPTRLLQTPPRFRHALAGRNDHELTPL